MEHNSAVSGHPISMSFSQVDGWSTDPRVLGHHINSEMHSVMRYSKAILLCS